MTKTKTVSVKLDSKLYTALKTRAELSNSNISDEIRSLLRSALAAEGLDLYGNEVAGFIRGVVDARMDVAALDIERKLDATEDRIAAVLSRPMTAAIMAGLMSADVLKASYASLDDVPLRGHLEELPRAGRRAQPRGPRPHRRGEAPRARARRWLARPSSSTTPSSARERPRGRPPQAWRHTPAPAAASSSR